MTDTPDLLRRAAKVLRDHAEPFSSARWRPVGEGVVDTDGKHVIEDMYGECVGRAASMHIALMDPPVVLALADLLETVARDCGMATTQFRDAATVARAILREDS